MADSTRLRILKNVRTTLQANTVAGGYNYTVAAGSVSLDPTVNLMTINGVDLPFIVIEATPDGNIQYFPSEQKYEIFRLNLIARVDAINGALDPTARADAWEKMIADFEKALTVDHTRGGNAVDTRLGTPAPFVGVGSPICVIVQPVDVKFYRRYGDPNA
jgi:hypothetical protein